MIFTLVLASPSASADDMDSTKARQYAVQMARQGDYLAALTILEPLYLDKPNNVGILHDYLAVLSWAESDRKVVNLFPKIDFKTAPLFVVSAAAKSLRRLGYWAAAEDIYRESIRRFPDDVDLKVGLILTVTDAGRTAEALNIANDFARNHPGKNEIIAAQIYAAEASNDAYLALLACQKMLNRERFNREARHRQIMLLHNLGAYARSLELAEQYPEAVTAAEYRRLRGDKIALEVRWARLAPVSENTRFSECEKAIELLEKTIDSPECQGPEDKACRRQARLDRMVALRECSSPEDIIEEYNNLVAEGEKLPLYVLEVAAGALLNKREPEKALNLYREIVRQDPKTYQGRTGLFFALIENENFSEARELIDKMVAEQPLWIYPGGTKNPRANWRRQTTEIFAALDRFYADDLAEAERRLTVMANEAPTNTDLLREQGTIYLARGWTSRARDVIELGQALEPDHRGLRIGHAETVMALRQYKEAGEEIDSLFLEYPENQQVQRLVTQWQLHNMREFRLETTLSNNSGSAYGDKEWGISTKVFSKPFLDQYRWFAGFSHTQAEFPEGSGDLQQYSAGIEYASSFLEAILASGFNDSESGRLGLWLDGTWYFDDRWSAPFSAEIFSRDTPLRAVHNGIHADALSLGITYRKHESRSFSLKGQVMDFSDSNFRSRLTLTGNQRLISLPKQKLTVFGEISASNNSRNGGPYFNPDSDLSLSAELEHLWRIYRRYEKSLQQRVSVSTGYYSQRGFGGDYILGFEYAHILALGNRHNMSYGAGIKRRVYDGDTEWSNYLFLSLNWRF